jgi:hypothetical protein
MYNSQFCINKKAKVVNPNRKSWSSEQGVEAMGQHPVTHKKTITAKKSQQGKAGLITGCRHR